MGHCLWVFGEHPTESISNLAESCYEMGAYTVEFFKTLDKKKLSKCVDELVQLYERFDNLTVEEKGELLCYVVGKYGVDIFAVPVTIKGVSLYKNLVEANRVCNLEDMVASITSREAIAPKALQQYSERCRYFKNVKIHWGKQNKHILGKHNFKKNSSVIEHENLEKLLRECAGAGIPVRGLPGQPGYKEVVDFKTHIGVWKDREGLSALPTTKATIHYGKDGAHIVPAHPNSTVW